MAGQGGQDVGVTVLAQQRVEVDDRPVHLRVDIDRGDRDHVETLVVDARQGLGDHLAQRLVEPRRARVAVLRRTPRAPLGLVTVPRGFLTTTSLSSTESTSW